MALRCGLLDWQLPDRCRPLAAISAARAPASALELRKMANDMPQSPRSERIEFALIFVLVLLLIFVVWMSHTHNDSLAAKGSDFIYGDLGALWGLAQATKNSLPY
jgi:hypothetical protein